MPSCSTPRPPGSIRPRPDSSKWRPSGSPADGSAKRRRSAGWCVPGEPIPAAATAIHGIDDAAVAQAPPFAEVWPRAHRPSSATRGDRPFARLRSGGAQARMRPRRDRRGNARARLESRLARRGRAGRDLAGYSLDQLAAWLGVEVTGRHSALGDAATTAQVFLALLPRLRDAGHPHAGRGRAGVPRARPTCSTEQHRAGWVERGRERRATAMPNARSLESTPIPIGIASRT